MKLKGFDIVFMFEESEFNVNTNEKRSAIGHCVVR